MGKSAATDTPTIITVFGATGDLMEKKLVPALFHLYENGRLPSLFAVVGFSRRSLTNQDFRDFVGQAVAEHVDGVDRPADDFLDLFSYQRGLFENAPDYGELAGRLSALDAGWNVCANKLFYLAVPPEHYESIFRQLAASGVTRPCSAEEGWTRVLVEKPFGKNLEHAEKLDALLGQLFKEEQVYRIDHYLAKEVLQNIVLFRFANNLLENVWNNEHIERIDIKLLESIGVEGRGVFYDGVGALLDVGQNHLLQMLALVAMENPLRITPETIRQKRSEVLEGLRPLTAGEIAVDTFRGQYAGYRNEPGVDPSSNTETYFKMKTFLDLPRWRDVPIFLESGKQLPKALKEIVVRFRHPTPCLCPPGRHYRNFVRFRLDPEPGITVRFWAKKPGTKTDIEPQVLDFKYLPTTPHEYLEEYPTLLLDCIAGDQTLFISSRETMAGWRFIDPICAAWRANAVPLHEYSKDEAIFTEAAAVERPAVTKQVPDRAVGMVGLGKMGANLARQLIDKGWTVAAFNKTPQRTRDLEKEGATGAYSLKELAASLKPPRAIWVMVPAGAAVDEVIFGPDGLVNHLSEGDILIDGGNSFYRDSVRRAAQLEKRKIRFVDVGVSGGPSGARHGGCLMVGGERAVYELLRPLLNDLAVPDGLQFFEGHGAGHFVKMVHNAIEYGMMQAIAEGFTILKHSDYDLNLTDVTGVYNHGSVIESRLMGWLQEAFDAYGEVLPDISGAVGHTGEAEWTLNVAKELGVDVPVLEDSVRFRVESARTPGYTGKILAALRNRFGGHAVDRQTPGPSGSAADPSEAADGGGQR